MDETTAALIAERGIWLSTQPFPPEIADSFPADSQELAKALEVIAGTDRTYKLARKHRIKTAFGTDILFSQKLAKRQGAILASLARWYSPPEILTMATSTNAELLQLSDKRHPYPGEVGMVQEGAQADLLLVEVNPLEDIALLVDPEKNFVVIMKDGEVAKNKLN